MLDHAPPGACPHPGPGPPGWAAGWRGLKVRSRNLVEAEQLGGLQERHVAWVECQETSTFDPDPTAGSGPVWSRVKWAQHEPSIDFFESDPGADETAWAYAGYLVPWGTTATSPSADYEALVFRSYPAVEAFACSVLSESRTTLPRRARQSQNRRRT